MLLPPKFNLGAFPPSENTAPAGAAVAAGCVPKLKQAGCAVVAGVLKEKSPAGWLLAGVCAAVPKLKPPEAAEVKKEKPVVAVVAAAVFGVPKVKPPPAAPDPKLNWFMAVGGRSDGNSLPPPPVPALRGCPPSRGAC